MPATSPRHTELLDQMRAGEGGYADWARAKFGDVRLTEWRYGHVKLAWEIPEDWLMFDGVMFGGHVASMADHVLSLVSLSALHDPAERFRTSQLQVQFFRPLMKPNATLEGRLVNRSQRFIHVEADFLNAEGKLAARVSAVQSVRMKQPESGA